MKRLLVGIILLGIVLWLSPIAGFILAIVFALFQSYSYYEIIAFGILIDIAYQTSLNTGLVELPIYTILGIVFFGLSFFIQKRINLHA